MQEERPSLINVTVTISAPCWIFLSVHVQNFFKVLLKCFGCRFRSVHLFPAICSLKSETQLVVLKIKSGRCEGAAESSQWKLSAVRGSSLCWPSLCRAGAEEKLSGHSALSPHCTRACSGRQAQTTLAAENHEDGSIPARGQGEQAPCFSGCHQIT